ncbi:DISARM system helicase DrmA [Thermococcus barophilus]|uniref:Helicase domain protein n=1 Tax=Thermococcus barophilus TaxID=55802 RepID=A0A0S1XCP7_THEBA|nr:DISARM system helicase DrmA [Thermococcus barophilus]ALM75549.1 Helicase domain protein [Thermococcus barophilus]
MGIRSELVVELVRELLGPRDGPYEELPENRKPLTEYVTGVLSPKFVSPEDLFEYEPAEGISGSEEITAGFEDEEEDSDVGAGFNPVLNPQSPPRSFGLSFAIEPHQGKTPSLAICVTWARYFWEGEKKVWKRAPRASCLKVDLKPCIAERERQYEYSLPERKVAEILGVEEPELSLKIITRRKRERLHISMFLVNNIRLANPDKIKLVQAHIFQPQIRVRIFNATLVPTAFGNEPDEIDFVYRNRRAYAKGHMCSAVWCVQSPKNCTDPELEPELEFSDEVPLSPPFKWGDSEVVFKLYRELAEREGYENPEKIAERMVRLFTPPSRHDRNSWKNFIMVRSEFIPIYAVSAPSFEWRSEFAPAPILEAGLLAEMWDPSKLRAALMPLYRGYIEWFKLQTREYMKLENEREKQIAKRILREIAHVIGRIRKGIRILETDENARLAFCFANKAMDIQFRWQHDERGLTWRPYQLAFLLMNIESVINPESPDRKICDLLWIPTGGGKTEAYLGLVAFTLAYRRRRALSRVGKHGVDSSGAGTGVISRYTLRLLTIQQFRRALAMITACEYLRVYGLKEGKAPGWRPAEYPRQDEQFLWGGSRFSVGLWVGGNLTPNRLKAIRAKGKTRMIPGAIEILQGKAQEKGSGEPAQILRCPVCGSLLAIPADGLEAKDPTPIHLTIRSSATAEQLEEALKGLKGQKIENTGIEIVSISIKNLPSQDFYVITLTIRSESSIESATFDRAWDHIKEILSNRGISVSLRAARASRPGYFLISRSRHSRNSSAVHDFEIYCPNPECKLNNTLWVEGYPKGSYESFEFTINGKRLYLHVPGNMEFRTVPDFARAEKLDNIKISSGESKVLSYRIPIPAQTVDEQIYRLPPSFLIATVDKFAQISFKPESAVLFGIVNAFSSKVSDFGYKRVNPEKIKGKDMTKIPRLDPPDLIIQDELHLISGPLGSMVGIYEIAVDYLSGNGTKYVASTATVKGAREHVGTLFTRQLSMFPPYGIIPGDRFFVRYSSAHPADETRPGRLYVGVLAPGRGPHTPLIRIWARLLQSVYDLRDKYPDEEDYFWTLVGYFNAIRELAGARSLYRQDIPERIKDLQLNPSKRRPVSDDNVVELSSRLDSTVLPALLRRLENYHAADAIFTTSMFGTGVDIGRLSLMVVNGQPKTTTSYIQATGRVGRKKAGLVVTFYRATRPRDLSHYEFFIGYHSALDRYVEPSTVAPLSQGTIERALGPVMVGILRNHPNPQVPWWDDETAPAMADARTTAPEVGILPSIFTARLLKFPESRRLLDEDELDDIVKSKLDRWGEVAKKVDGELRYHEYFQATKPVVLGTPAHEYKRLPVVYPNAPNSLRDIEETVGFQITTFRR